MSDSEQPEGTDDVPSEDRDTDGRIHFSRLKLMAKSPAHYLADARSFSTSFALGRATHSYLLGQEDKLIVWEGKRYDGVKKPPKKDGPVRAYQEFKAAHPKSQIVSASEMRKVRGMKAAIDRHPEARELLRGNRENYMQWEVQGHRAAGTPDVWRPDGDVVELKTDDCTEPESFLRSAERYGYHAQLSWYAAGLWELGLENVGRLSIVAVESGPPHCVTVVHLSDDIVAEGTKLWRGWLAKLEECEALGDWPGYSSQPVTWGLRG
jgi:PDDEXK-like domain of unknown function (DUF3799)